MQKHLCDAERKTSQASMLGNGEPNGMSQNGRWKLRVIATFQQPIWSAYGRRPADFSKISFGSDLADLPDQTKERVAGSGGRDFAVPPAGADCL